MTRTHATRGDNGPASAAEQGSLSVPVRRSRWVSFWVGVAAALFSLLTAAALAGSLLLLPLALDGMWVVFAFGVLWFGLFFLSLPRQRRCARSFDLRRPGARLAGGLLSIPLGDGAALSFNLGEPHGLTFGWDEVLMTGSGPTTHTRGLMTFALLSQGGQELLLVAEDSVREAQSAGWPRGTSQSSPDLRARLWAEDLVTLVEAVRSHVPPTAAGPKETMPPTDADKAPGERVREWPVNPLPARNRHEVSLFLEWLKVELISRAPTQGGEVCVGRVRGADPAAAPDTYRLVFNLLEDDPADENDFGSGASKLFDPSELMLLLSRMKREGLLGTLSRDPQGEVAHVLTYRTTREVEAFRRSSARGLALIEQLTRFAQADGNVAEESIKGSAQRTWFRGARERFDAGALGAMRQALGENLRLLQAPSPDTAAASKQAALVRELRGRCPEYLDRLQGAGFEPGHVLHPLFSHAYHLTRFAARALQAGRPAEARAAFAAWAAVEPSEFLFPAREFADAVYESKLEPETAATLVPPAVRQAFSSYYGALLDPDYNPWSY